MNLLSEINTKLKNNGKIVSKRLTEKYLKNIGLLDQILERTIYLGTDSSLLERIYNIENNINSKSSCLYCGLPTSFKSRTEGYSEFCSTSCQLRSPLTKKKREEKSLERYGTKNPFQSNEYKLKRKTLNLEKYGVENYTQSRDFKEKSKKTLSDKYGVSNISQLSEIKEKKKQTNLIKYGTETYSQSIEGKIKIKKSILKKYGSESFFQSKYFLEKKEKTNLHVYGFLVATKSSTVKRKIKKTNLKKYGVISPLNLFKNLEKAKKVNKERCFINSKEKYKKYYNIDFLFDFNYYLKHSSDKNTFTLRCNTCGNEFTSKLTQSGREYGICRCYNCFPIKRTIAEGEIELFLHRNGISDISKNNRKILNGKELDLYLPQNNIGIEYNGILRHSCGYSKYLPLHNLDNFEKIKEQHLQKTLGCKELGIELFHINENEWIINKGRKIWENHLLFKLNLLSSKEYLIENIIKRTYYVEELRKGIFKIDRRFSNGSEFIRLGFKVLNTLPPLGYKVMEDSIFEMTHYNGETLQEGERVLYNSGYLILGK